VYIINNSLLIILVIKFKSKYIRQIHLLYYFVKYILNNNSPNIIKIIYNNIPNFNFNFAIYQRLDKMMLEELRISTENVPSFLKFQKTIPWYPLVSLDILFHLYLLFHHLSAVVWINRRYITIIHTDHKPKFISWSAVITSQN